MEVGAVKQAFNTELILLKKKLNQAKIQIIHKLTRKAKTFTERKAPEALQEKLKRKAESAVIEVLIIKKINPKDIARFAITHTGQLSDHLNKPNVDQDKACARLLLHKSLQDKYKLIRTRFSSIPIDNLLMSREERRKLKKEARDKQKNKRKEREEKAKNVVNAEGVWDVEDVDMSDSLKEQTVSKKIDTYNDIEEEEESVTLNGDEESEGSDEEMNQNESDIESVNGQDDEHVDNASKSDDESNNKDNDKSEEEIKTPTKLLKSSKNKLEKVNIKNVLNGTNIEKVAKKNPISTLKEKKPNKNKTLNETHVDDLSKSDDDESNNEEEDISDEEMKPPTKKFKPGKSEDKQEKVNAKNVVNNKSKIPKVAQKNPIHSPNEKKLNKNKNLNEKLLSRKFKKDSIEAPVHETKIVDPFFITSTGENYMTVVEPRPPDEVKEVHKEGNRKLRRAVMFGHVPKIKPRQKDFARDDSRFTRNSGFNKNNNSKTFNDKEDFSNVKRNFTNKGFNTNKEQESKPEKLHPSWEAKKRQSGIQPFRGKKIVFDES